MPAPLVPSTALVEVRATIDSQKVENTLWFRKLSGSLGQAELNALATSVRSWWFASVLPLLPAAVQFREVVATDRGTADGFQGDTAVGAGTGGGIAVAATPNNVSLSVSFRTGRRGRSRRGRNYWLAIPGDQVTANTVGDDYIADIIAAYQDLVGTGISGWEWVVVSLREGDDWRTEALITPVTTVVVVDTTVDSQRGRLPGRGQ